MPEKKAPPPPPKPSRTARAERLAAALKANLAKRKAQAKARDAAPREED